MFSFRQFFVIQCRSNGKFITDECSFCVLLRTAGRADSLDEAVETGSMILGDDFDVVGFWERAA
jgi:hypothetical protein